MKNITSFLKHTQKRLLSVYRDYPRQFWILMAGAFIDQLGGALLFPFFTLYVTQKFSVGMTEVGGIFALFSIANLVGSLVGGAITDRIGRKGMILFGLITSATSSVIMGYANTITLFLFITLLVGLLSNSAGPARQAMVADLLPENRRAEGFGILRVIANLAVTIGPLIGGLIASVSYLWLFIIDAITSLITAVIILFTIRETMKPRPVEGQQESMVQTFGGYGLVLRDLAFAWFLGASVLMVLVYMQMNTTLAVYLRDVHGIPAKGFGYILSLNAAMVVLFQFSITRWISRYRPLVIMAVGTLFYAIGFGMYGFVASFPFFLLAMVIITIGEMFVSPVGQAIAATLAPEDMRGRYMAVFGLSWVVPTAVGPLLAGMLMDNADPRWVWWSAGIIALVSALAFHLLEFQIRRIRYTAIARRLHILEKVETGELSAERAAKEIASVHEGSFGRLAPGGEYSALRYLHIHQEEPESLEPEFRAMKIDLRLPVGLVNAVLHSGGRLSDRLDKVSDDRLQNKVASRVRTSSIDTEPDQDQSGVDISIE